MFMLKLVPLSRRPESRQTTDRPHRFVHERSGQDPRGSAHQPFRDCRNADVGCCDNDFGWDVTLAMTNNSWKKKARRQQIANGVSYTRARREVDREYDAQSRVNADTLLSALGIENPDSLDVEALWEPRRRPAGATRQMLLGTPLGLTPEGNPVWLDLKDAPLGGHGPHGVMIGMTGSGKSTALQTMVLGLCALHSPEVLQVIPVSGYKESALDAFANYPHVTIQPAGEAGSEPEAGAIAQTLDRLIEQRSQALTDAGMELTGRRFRDAHAYHKARDAGAELAPMPYTVIMVDELPQDEPTAAAVFHVLRHGRELGVRVLVSAQDLQRGYMWRILENSTYRIVFKTITGQASRYLLGADAAYFLTGPGHGFLATSSSNDPVAFRMFPPLPDSVIESVGRQLTVAATTAD